MQTKEYYKDYSYGNQKQMQQLQSYGSSTFLNNNKYTITPHGNHSNRMTLTGSKLSWSPGGILKIDFVLAVKR